MQISNLLNLGPGGVSDQAVSPVKVPAENTASVSAVRKDAGEFKDVLNRKVSAQNESDEAKKSQESGKDDTVKDIEQDNSNVDHVSSPDTSSEAKKTQDSQTDNEKKDEKAENPQVDPVALSLMSIAQIVQSLTADPSQPRVTQTPSDGSEAVQKISAQMMDALGVSPAAAVAVPATEGKEAQAADTATPSAAVVPDVNKAMTVAPAGSEELIEAAGTSADSLQKETVQQPAKNVDLPVAQPAAAAAATDQTVSAEKNGIVLNNVSGKETAAASMPASTDAQTQTQLVMDFTGNNQVQAAAQAGTAEKTDGHQGQEHTPNKDAQLEFPSVLKNSANNSLSIKPEALPFVSPQNAVVSPDQSKAVETTRQLDAAETRRVMSDIVSKIHTSIGDKVHETTIELKPDFLGRMNIRLSVEGDRVSVRMQVANAAVRELVESNFSTLRDSLRDRGFTMDNVQVNVNTQGQDYNLSQQQTLNQPLPAQSAAVVTHEEGRPDAFAVSGIREEFALADTGNINYLI